MFCQHCGKQVSEVDVFCGYCGTGLRPIKQHVIGDAERVGRYAEQPTERLSSQVKATFLATERVNAMVGEQGALKACIF